MKTYTVLYAEDVPHYGSTEIEAENDAEAIAKASDISDEELGCLALDRNHTDTYCKRIVLIEDPEGNSIAADISLDEYTLIYGEDKRRKIDAADAMFEALEAQEMAEFDPEAALQKARGQQ